MPIRISSQKGCFGEESCYSTHFCKIPLFCYGKPISIVACFWTWSPAYAVPSDTNPWGRCRKSRTADMRFWRKGFSRRAQCHTTELYRAACSTWLPRPQFSVPAFPWPAANTFLFSAYPLPPVFQFWKQHIYFQVLWQQAAGWSAKSWECFISKCSLFKTIIGCLKLCQHNFSIVAKITLAKQFLSRHNMEALWKHYFFLSFLRFCWPSPHLFKPAGAAALITWVSAAGIAVTEHLFLRHTGTVLPELVFWFITSKYIISQNR